MNLKVIYEPAGRAEEYSKLALNIYKGCNFGCEYCFGPSTLRREKEDFHKNIELRKDFLRKLELDCIKLKDTKERVLLCFVTDPYNDTDLELKLTREVIRLFKVYNIPFHVLTKGGMRAARDFDLYKKGDAFASTLTFLDEKKSKLWEPKAAPPVDRLNALKLAHSKGIETWVSLEPVVDVNESLAIIKTTAPYVDLFKVGKLNYHPLAATIDWRKFGYEAIELLEKLGKAYYIKNDLRDLL